MTLPDRPRLTNLINDIRLGIDCIKTVSAMNYCSNFTDLNNFFDTFFAQRNELEKICGQNPDTVSIEEMPACLDAVKSSFGENQWALVMFKAGYIYLGEKSFLPILGMLTEAALMDAAPLNLKIITLRMHQMLGVEPDRHLMADERLHLKDGDLQRLQAEVDEYRLREGRLPESLVEALSAEDKEMVSRLLLPLTIDPQSGEVLTEELLRRRYLGGRRQNHMSAVERYIPEAFENPVN